MPSSLTLALVALIVLAYLAGRRSRSRPASWWDTITPGDESGPPSRLLAGDFTGVDEALALDAARDVEEHLLSTWLEQEGLDADGKPQG
jgi:hypothetical protein